MPPFTLLMNTTPEARLNLQLVNSETIPLELLCLNPIQEAHFCSLIEASSGRARVMIHPFYYWKTEKLQRYYPLLTRLLASQSDTSLPLVIFEREDEIKSTHERFLTMASDKIKSKMLFVPTYPRNPEPYCSDMRGLHTPEARKKRWMRVIEALTSLGTIEIMLGGQLLVLTSYNEDAVQYDKCVEWARENLHPHFKVTFSAITWPHQAHKDIF